MKQIKFTLIAIVAMIVVSGTAVYASFPVKKETNKTEVSVQDSKSNSSTSTISAGDVTNFKKAELAKNAKAGGMDEEMIITLVLWFFLGWAAAHRWYRGKPAIYNVLFIITAGGCGIWALVDLINILTGKF